MAQALVTNEANLTEIPDQGCRKNRRENRTASKSDKIGNVWLDNSSNGL